MKRISTFFLLGFSVFLGCTNDSQTSSKPPSTLVVSKDQIDLTSIQTVDSSIVRLSCGCGFNFVVENYSGDTTAINYNSRYFVDSVNKTSIVFTQRNSSPSGSYTAKLAFLSTGSKGDFRDTITVHSTK